MITNTNPDIAILFNTGSGRFDLVDADGTILGSYSRASDARRGRNRRFGF